ncbi:hypothetical protein O7635_29380 [Asanoa sp. WMMD1127]|uniref:hypothetical protein n=1 Tax=Asanoa sp. WMMD1127 TaxID=3016107 RepID=UPI002417D30D|nr:hypothetical protein [Asanoa sp. WMMD1127]MDG4825981.1 hypothetical protein [Asanoa sp. WMMD1127]
MTDTRDDFVVSFKPHPGYDAPLFVIKGSTAAEIADKIASVEATGLFATVGNADKTFKGFFLVGSELGGQPVEHPSTVQANGYTPPATPPPAAPAGTPPGMTAPTCPHGTKVFKTGQGKRGEWKAWMCPARQGDPSQCKPEWL